jgi:hypothetical protein
MAKEKSSIQEIIEIDRVEGSTIFIKDGGLRKVLLTSGINFDLKSEEEKELLVFNYQEFLNSLNFPVQEIIHSRKINIGRYLKLLKSYHDKEESSLLKKIIKDYYEFIDNYISKNPIMTKTFFIVVPYQPGINTKKIINLFTRKKGRKLEQPDVKKDIEQLDLRVDEVAIGLNRVGLRAVLLEEEDLKGLFRHFYNPQIK